MTQTKTTIYGSLTLKVRTPDGTMYVFVSEDITGRPVNIQVSAGKCGTSFSAWASCMCGLLSHLLEGNLASIPDLIVLLSDHNTDKDTPNGNGIYTKSGPHGLKVALMMYLNHKNKLESITSNNNDVTRRLPRGFR